METTYHHYNTGEQCLAPSWCLDQRRLNRISCLNCEDLTKFLGHSRPHWGWQISSNWILLTHSLYILNLFSSEDLRRVTKINQWHYLWKCVSCAQLKNSTDMYPWSPDKHTPVSPCIDRRSRASLQKRGVDTKLHPPPLQPCFPDFGGHLSFVFLSKMVLHWTRIPQAVYF